MPPQTLALAAAASIYPPAVAAVIALGRGRQLRSRVFAFVLAAFLVTYATGVALLIALAVRLRRKRPDPDAGAQPPGGASRIDRYLTSRRLAFALGIVLYVVPSPIYIGAAKTIADAKLSPSAELLDLAVAVAVMLWLIELPMLLLLIVPGRAERVLEETHRWFARNGQTLAIVASAAAGAYLAIKGVLDLGS